MVHYRKFRNTDPPGLVEVWNEVVGGHGAPQLTSSTNLERCVLAKPYFDPAGLIVAEDDAGIVGFAHAGFGPDAAEQHVSTRTGVVCFLGVRRAERRKGIGSRLLEHAEAYLRDAGVQTLLAGPHRPQGPFYEGLYGGSELPGFLASLTDIHPFLSKRHYQVTQEVVVLQRKIRDAVKLIDPRLGGVRQQLEFGVGARRSLGTWWQECLLGPVEPLEFYLVDKSKGEQVARALGWYMEGFGSRPDLPTAGILDLEVKENRRRAGLGKFFLAQIIRALQEQYFEVAELQIDQSNQAGLKLCRALGFTQVDVGKVYKKEAG